MKKSLLIFGVSGFAGSYLATEFFNNGYEIYGSDVQTSERLSDYVSFEKCDLLDNEAVEQLICKVQPTHIINLAAISSVGVSWSIPQKTVEVNVVGALNILEAVKAVNKNIKVMFIGSSEEYAVADVPIDENSKLNANNPYGISKAMQENFAHLYRERYGMRVYCVRPFNHTGVGQNENFVLPSWCKQAAEIEKSGKPGTIKVGNLEAERDFSDVRDVVNAYRLIIESNDCSQIYNIGSGKTYKLSELLDYIISLCSQKITVEVDLDRFRPVDNKVICCDNHKIMQSLNWRTYYSVFDSLQLIYNSYF